MKNNPIEKIRDLLAEPEARRKAAICAGLAAALAVGGAGIAIASNRPEPIDSTPSAVEKAGADDKEASGAESVAPADIAKICPTLTLDGQDVGTTAEVVNGSGGHVISDGVWNSDGVHDAGYEQNAGTVTDSTGGTSGSSASGSAPAQSQKKWVPEQGHWETDYGQVWVPNVVYVRHERYWVVTPNGNVGPFDSKSAANAWVYNDMVNGGKGGSLLDDSYTTSEDQGHYEQQATGRHWVVDVAGHWE